MTKTRGRLWRSRWAALGAAVAVTVGAGGGFLAHGASTGASTFVPVTPCRLADTRTTNSNSPVGIRTSSIGNGETVVFTVRGSNGQCTGIPADATGVSLNVTISGPTSASFLVLWPSGGESPERLEPELGSRSGSYP